MNTLIDKSTWNTLSNKIEGKLQYDNLSKILYATDASVYRKLPSAVVFPKTTNDIQQIVQFATKNKIGIIPRTAGTSLAGQCVGSGLVMDVSKHLNKIISFDKKKKIVTVQPGVIRDDLNRFLKPHGLFFGPNTSTSNRCMIGGMVGNNSSGTTSIQYGVTRDKVIELQTILSDGSLVNFTNASAEEKKATSNELEADIYNKVINVLGSEENQKNIKNNYPKPEIHRRNTGYALDVLLNNSYLNKESNTSTINLCDILCGSEGTLAITTQVTLQLDDLPPNNAAMVAAHFSSIENCMQSVALLMEHQLYTCEMMDKTILDCTKNNTEQLKNRFFVEGDPKAILMLELRSNSEDDLNQQIYDIKKTLLQSKLSYASPVLYNEDINKALELRKAGLGLLGNMVGDRKAVACIEDTAVTINDLSDYILEFTKLMESFGQEAVYYAHAGAGEIHLRPILNLKKSSDVKLFKEITDAVAVLVKKYNGSMSGEHGDGIVRSGYIPQMIGNENYQLLREIKQAFDPHNIFNPGKIIDPLPMDKNLRYQPDRKEPKITTKLDFSDSEGILKIAEKCNGSGDCRKSVEAGGGMCPSYRATKNEQDTTRARANTLREVLTTNQISNKFVSKELKQVFDLCVSCKACASECPSNVDVALLKSEFLYQYKKEKGASLRDKAFAYNTTINKVALKVPKLSSFLFKNKYSSTILKKSLGIAKERSLPVLNAIVFEEWLLNYLDINKVVKPIKQLYLFVDEFTNYLDFEIGKDTVELLTSLNYKVNYIKHKPSGRTFISKGFLEEAQELIDTNISIFNSVILNDTPLIGIEPSAILSFKDEYIRLASNTDSAKEIAKNVFIIDDFIANEIKEGNIKASSFSDEEKTIKLHVHCHQKALANVSAPFNLLNLPTNYTVSVVNSGCCGMAGSFGYEHEHYKVSMQMGELSLFPKIRKANKNVVIAATGTSCRDQIKDGTNRVAKHPISILRKALLNN